MNVFIKTGLIIIGLMLIITQINWLCAIGGFLVGIAIVLKNNKLENYKWVTKECLD